MSDTVGISIAGCGEVGSAVAKILLERRPALDKRLVRGLRLRRVLVRDPSKPRSVDLPDGLLTTDAADLLDCTETHVVVELMGGIDDARTLILAALAAGKDVVTANKALLATCGAELFAAARSAGRCIAFEASVAGGIPVLDAVRRGLIANEIDAVFGILNGTCNYILTQMLQRKIGYAQALTEAQQLGYAEADPTLDVDGTDSAHKLAILASIAMRRQCDLDRIVVRGITDLELTDLVAGEELGHVCKLLAVARRHHDGLELTVQPTFIRKSHLLAGVSGPFNAVSVYGDAVGHTLFYGRGAGGMPTASAVVADIVDVATGGAAATFSQTELLPDRTQPATFRVAGESVSPYYIRMGLLDRPGGVAKIATVLGDAGISIASVVQHEAHEMREDGAVPVVVMVRPTTDATVQAAVRRIGQIAVVTGQVVCIPALDENAESHPKD